jgi:hypothetical protein
MSEGFDVFVEDLRDKKLQRLRGVPAKYQKTRDIFSGLGDRRKDPQRRSGRVIIVVPPKNSTITITCTDEAIISDSRKITKENASWKKELKAIHKKLKAKGFILYKKR